jgi:glycerol kinase
MQRDARVPLKELRVDGGACANNLLMQFQADVLDVPVVRPRISETTAIGAAYLAGLAVGYWKNRADVTRQWQVERRFRPAMKAGMRKTLTAGWAAALDRARGPGPARGISNGQSR